MSEPTPSTSTSADPTPETTPIFTQDDHGNITMGEAPDWNNMTKEQVQVFMQNMFNLNKALVQAVNDKPKKPIKKDMGILIKRQPPPMFNGKVSELRAFQTQLKAYFKDFENTLDTENKKVSFAASRLEGTALKWFRPMWDVYLDNPNGPLPEPVRKVFDSFEEFEGELVKAFGDVGELRMAENKLSEIRQKGRCSDYAVKFRDLASRVTWGQSALIKRFYDGLSRNVKEKVYDIDRTNHDLISFMEKCVTADNLLYELNMGNQNSNHERSNQGKKRQEPVAKDNSGTPGPMDIGMMQKGNGKKRDFKCYNCGKPNHMARNCKSPKKERIPEPKNNHAMEKDDKSVHMMERLTSSDNEDDYEFYHSESELSDDSKTLDEEPETEIPDRQPVLQIDFRQLSNIESTVSNQEDDDTKWRNYGLPHKRDEDIWRAHENYTPEMRKLDEFHHGIVESEEPINGNTPIALYKWLHEMQTQGSETQLILRAVTLDRAWSHNLPYRYHHGDHEHMNPTHPLHYRISWTSCITHICMGHFKEKHDNDVFPVRIPFTPHKNVYHNMKFYNWMPTQRYRSLKVVILEPGHCDYGEGELWECGSAFCNYHQTAKLMEWQDRSNLRWKYDCEEGQFDYEDCPEPKCERHASMKINNWHHSKNYDSPL
jgi:hypothetical protein